MKRYTDQELEALLNWDKLHCKPPFRTDAEKKQYYSRYVERMLWRYLTTEDWRVLAKIVDDLRVPQKLREATKFLVARHT